jgi:hypothetical protein
VRTIIALVFFALLLGPAATTAEKAAGPRISVKQDRYDLGKVKQGTQAVHVFEIQNTGTETLVIDRVLAS